MITIYKPTNGDCRTTVPILNRSFFNALFKFIYCSLFILIPIAASAQTVVTGTVKDEKGLPAVGTSVTETDVKNGTSVDANGKFTITLKGKLRVLNFTLVGYKTQRITVGASNVVTVNLEEDLNKLNEVVVVGYGTQRKTDLTGSISSIKSEDLNLGGTTSNIGQAIQGKAAGVQVQQTSFAPGAGMSITVRGGNSINTTNSPLYVVDGFISDNGSTINPNDIEDIQILKDASSAAIYGARGGNGVVLITTKKGKAGRVAIDLDLSNGNQFLTYKPSLLNGQQYTAIQNATAIEDGKPALFPPSFAIANTNWLNEATQNASVHNRSLSISSGDQNSKLYVSGNYINQKGVLKGTGLEKYTARIGAEKTLNERLKLGANFYGSSSKVLQQSYSADITAPLFGLLTALPNIPVYNADGSYYRYQGKDNPLASLLEPTNTSTNKLANANVSLDYQIIKGLTYHLGGGAEYTNLNEGQYIPRTLSAGAKNGGLAAQKSSTTFRWLVENYLTYKYKTGDHDFTVLAGVSNQKDVNDYIAAGSKGFPTDAYLFYNLGAGSTPNGSGVTISNLGNGYNSFKEQSTFNSMYGRINYNYKDKLLTSFTLRRDGSSKFGPNYSYGYFPSGAIAYKFTDEEFIKNLNTFSNLKLRASYGVTGNDRVPNYLYLATFTNYSTVLNPGSPLQIGTEPKTLPNPDLKWESTTQYNFGIDMGFLNGRVNATIDLYAKKTTNLLINIPLEQYWGFNSITVNAGSIQNRGIEFLVNAVNVRNDDFTWNTNFNISLNRQKVLSLGPVNQISVNTANPSGTVSGREFSRVVAGRELGELFGYVYTGVIKTGENYTPQPGSKAGDPKYQDTNGDGKITPDDMTFLGNSTPRFTLGFGNDFHYKGFDLNIFFQSSFGYSLYNMNRLVLESTTSTDALNRFVAGVNENTDVPREGYFLSTYGSYVNSRFVEDASYLRLKSVSLGYSVPTKWLDHIKVIKGFRVYAEAQNLFTITNYSGTDPEVNSHSGSNFGGGIDFNAFPAFRTFSAGVKLTIN